MITQFEKEVSENNPRLKKEIIRTLLVPENHLLKSNKEFDDKKLFFVKNVIEDKDMFEKLYFLLKTNDDNICFNFVKDYEVVRMFSITKASLADEFCGLVEGKKLNKISEERVGTLLDIIDIKNHKEELCDGIFEYTIGQKNFSIHKKDLYFLLICSQKEYDKFFKNAESKFFGCDKREYLYLLEKFIEKEKICVNCFIPKDIKERILDVTKKRKIDFQSVAIHYSNEIDNEFLSEITLNSELKDEVFGEMPKYLSVVEKCVFIYIKLCNILTYDGEFYINGQTGNSAQKHEDFSRLCKINSKLNDVVCYDFNAIYAKLLSEIGVDLAINNYGYENKFGGGHANLSFKTGKFIVEADAINSILRNDLFLTKINSGTRGLVCKNDSQKTRQEFEDIVQSMRILICEQNRQKNLAKKLGKRTEIVKFEDCIKNYVPIFEDEEKEQLFEDNLNIMLSNVKHQTLNDCEDVFYLLELKKRIFKDKNFRNNVNLVILKENENQKSSLTTVLTLGKNVNNENEQLYNFIYNKSEKNFNFVTEDKLREKLTSGELEYIGGNKPFIPKLNRVVEYDEDFKQVVCFE